jgi:hypothetical protein
MPFGPFRNFQLRAAVLLDWDIFAAVAGDVEKAGAREKDFVRSKPYF